MTHLNKQKYDVFIFYTYDLHIMLREDFFKKFKSATVL